VILAIKMRWLDFKYGHMSGFPLCCVMRYSLCRFNNQAVRRGGTELSDGTGFVTCGIFHHDDGTDAIYGWPDFNSREPWSITQETYDSVKRNYLWERAHGLGTFRVTP
jgi:hypothetical protein